LLVPVDKKREKKKKRGRRDGDRVIVDRISTLGYGLSPKKREKKRKKERRSHDPKGKARLIASALHESEDSTPATLKAKKKEKEKKRRQTQGAWEDAVHAEPYPYPGPEGKEGGGRVAVYVRPARQMIATLSNSFNSVYFPSDQGGWRREKKKGGERVTARLFAEKKSIADPVRTYNA